jgi:hypothetical protein
MLNPERDIIQWWYKICTNGMLSKQICQPGRIGESWRIAAELLILARQSLDRDDAETP